MPAPFTHPGATMDANTRQTIQGFGPDAAARLEALERDVPPATFEQLLSLCVEVDDHAADRGFAQQRQTEHLLRQHLASGAWWEVLWAHCEGAGWGCCEHPATPQQ